MEYHTRGKGEREKEMLVWSCAKNTLSNLTLLLVDIIPWFAGQAMRDEEESVVVF